MYDSFELVTPDDEGAAIAGDYSVAVSDCEDGLAIAGQSGIAIACEDYGTAAAGENGAMVLGYWDTEAHRMRFKIAHVGENSILPDVAYGLDDNHEFFAL